MKIYKEITIDELISKKPETISYLQNKGIKCIACGEPVWGTLEEFAKLKGFSESEINTIVEEINNL